MDNLAINVTDIVVIVILLLSGALAFVRGLVHETLSIGAWVGAAVVTLYLFPIAQPIARDYIAIELAADITAGVAIFLVALILFSIVSRTLSRQVQESSLGALDRTLGLLFGFLRGAVIVCVAWLVLVWLLPVDERPGWITEAKSRPLIERGAALLQALIPEDIRIRGENAAERAKDTTEDAIETEESLRNLLTPQPEPEAKDDADSTREGYNPDQRDEMQRLIENTD
ncbi:MAG: CvpA family protein [Rhodovibrionaceae bacterium]